MWRVLSKSRAERLCCRWGWGHVKFELSHYSHSMWVGLLRENFDFIDNVVSFYTRFPRNKKFPFWNLFFWVNVCHVVTIPNWFLFSFFPFPTSQLCSTNEKHVAGVSLLLCVKVLLAKQKTQDVCCLGAVDTFVSCTINYFYQLAPQPEQDKASPKLNSFVFVLQNSSSFMTPSFLFAWRLNPQKDLWLFVQHFFCCFDILLLSWERWQE